jgi:Zn-dependent peptidase ImmA (M78 family)
MENPRFEPLVLKWARESRFGPTIETLTAQWIDSWGDLSPALIAAWESGVSQPTFPQVRKLAEIYKQPPAVFFLDSPPPEKRNPPDLRTVDSGDNKTLSPEALLVIRKARRIQEIAADLSNELGEKLFFKYRRFSLDDNNASDLGEQIRADLSISAAEQFEFRKFDEFFEYLRKRIESTGILTLKSGLQDSFPTADCRAFSFADQLPYLILVNNKDFEGAKNFSLAHELAHILLREPGICNNYRSFGRAKSVSKVEVFCNQFAASFLVPSKQLSVHSVLRGRKTIPLEEIDAVAERLALEFKVSRVVIIRRLLTLGLIPLSSYTAKTKTQKEEPLLPRKPGGRFSLTTALKKNGTAFSSLVIHAYEKKKISYAGASDYLGVKTKHLRGLEKLINLHATG